MTEYYEIVKNFLGKNNWVNTIVLVIMGITANSKLNDISTALEVDKIKIEALENAIDDYKRESSICNKKLAQLNFNLQAHLGEAYIREDDELD